MTVEYDEMVEELRVLENRRDELIAIATSHDDFLQGSKEDVFKRLRGYEKERKCI